jgi:peptidoglycan/xylan/chitin deacetylase (PgdA/CDA1 family)
VSLQRIALTFDDGPSEWTEPILDILAANDALATFFVIGSAVEERVNTLERIVAEGHEIGNHTWSHPRLASHCDDQRVLGELERTNALLRRLLGSPPLRFRAPHYDVDARVETLARSLGLVHTPGDVTPPDWDERFSERVIATHVLQRARSGDVVGLHDGVPPAAPRASRQRTVDAVALILPRLRERGTTCVAASALFDGRAG